MSIIAIVIVVLIVLTIISKYVKAPPNKAYAISGLKKPEDLIVPDLLEKSIEPGKKLISVDVRENSKIEILTNDIGTTITDIQNKTEWELHFKKMIYFFKVFW